MRGGLKDGKREARAYVRARRWVCPGAVWRAHSCDLQLMKLWVQSRRMSNKYVSRRPVAAPALTVVHRHLPPPSLQPGRTTYPLHPLPSQSFPVSPCHSPHRPSSRGSSSCPGPMPSTDSSFPRARFNPLACSSYSSVLSASGWFDPERNHRSVRAYMFLTALILLSLLLSLSPPASFGFARRWNPRGFSRSSQGLRFWIFGGNS